MVKGYSGKPDLDELAGSFWGLCVSCRAEPYIERVPTDSNPADDPSRAVFKFLRDSGAIQVDEPHPLWLVDGIPWEDHLPAPDSL